MNPKTLKRVGVLLVVLAGAVLASPSFLPLDAEAFGLRPIRLGLDLRGGVHFIYEVDLEDVAERVTAAYAADVRAALRDARLRADAEARDGDVVVELAESESVREARAVLSRIQDPFGTGMYPAIRDETEGNRRLLRITIPDAALDARKQLALVQNVTILRSRIDALGVSEPVVQQQGANRIIVQVPGVEDPAQLDRVLGSTATLEWRLEDMLNDPYDAARSGRAPRGSVLRYAADGTPHLLQRQVIASGEHLTSAAPGYDEGRPAVLIRLGGIGASRMLDATQANVGKRLAVLKIEETRVPDARAESGFTTERIENVIFSGRIDGVFSNSFRLSGGFSPSEANELALVLRSGALAAPLFKVYSGTVSATLGQDNVERGRRALILGLLAVAVFMAVRYGSWGMIANAALLANLLIMIGVLAALRAALTLPGMAGILLTVGMAVDANVLINERIREELRSGLSPGAAMRRGYDKAWSSIADANLTTLIAAIVLLWFGTGPIRNFAVTLGIGVVTSMFTAVAGTRVLAEWLVERQRKRAARHM